MRSQNSNSSYAPTALLAEDDSLIRELVSGYLENLGYQVKEAPNGAEALQLIDENDANTFDVIVTDLLMPKASGDVLIAHARECGACNRFLVMSGNTFDPRFQSSCDDEEACFIEKPFTFGDFEEKLNRLARPFDGKPKT